MLKHLEFEVTFASTGLKLSGNHDFQSGMTSITGANEKGKSMRIEMIRFALWGSKALRASMTAYKSLKASVRVDLKGNSYTVSRTKSDATLSKGDEVIAKGTKAVNAAIIKLFGYNMDVFDSTNACLQGEVEAMTNMLPSERKAMVDRTIGLHVIDDLVKDIAVDMSKLRGRIEGITPRIIEVTEPIKPDAYAPSSEIEVLIETETENEKKRAVLTAQAGFADHLKAPVQPKEQIWDKTIPEMQEITDRYKDLRARMKAIGTIAKPDKVVTEEEIAARFEAVKKFEAYQRWARKDYKAPNPEWTDDFFMVQRTMLDVLEANRLLKMHETECPKCHHRWHQESMELLQTRANALPPEHYFEPVFKTIHECDSAQKQWLRDQADYDKWLAEKPEEVEDPKETSADIISDQQLIVQAKQYLKSLEVEKEFMNTTDEDLSEEIEARRAYESAMATYQRELATYTEAIERADIAKKQLAEIPDPVAPLDLLKAMKNDAVKYETEVAVYNSTMSSVAQAKQELAVVKGELEQLTAARAGLQDLKPKVKAYLVPSLSRVASKLLSEMTGGARNVIEVTDEFDIVVDNQPVETLSGSGKAVANLAVRIALSTVLTNKVFSVFLGDEIDAAMDKDRAAYTANCIRNLSGTISQIILVSHQQPEADHRIEL